MTNPIVVLRHTISKQTQEYTAAEAQHILSHPVWGAVLEVVDVAKPEVLGKPYTLDEDGERVPVKDAEPDNKKGSK